MNKLGDADNAKGLMYVPPHKRTQFKNEKNSSF